MATARPAPAGPIDTISFPKMRSERWAARCSGAKELLPDIAGETRLVSKWLANLNDKRGLAHHDRAKASRSALN
jgi:hypothetical protein